MRVVQKVLSIALILNLGQTSRLNMSLNCTEIITKMCISFSGFIRSRRVLPQEKCSASALLSSIYLSIYLSRKLIKVIQEEFNVKESLSML